MTTFPNSPIQNQEYTENGVTYTFTGSKWKKVVRSNSFRGELQTSANNAIDFDLSRGNFFEMNYDSDTTVAFSNPPLQNQTQRFEVLANAPESEGFSIANASYDNVSSITQDTSSHDIFFKPDGKKVYIVDASNNRIREYTLSIPWRVDSFSSTSLQIFSVATQEGTSGVRSVAFDPTGSIMFTVGVTADAVFRYNLSSPWNITSAVYASQSFSIATQEAAPHGISFKPDGTKFYITGTTNRTIFQYNLPTPWSLVGATYENKFASLNAQDTAISVHRFDNSGTRLFAVGTTNDRVYEYSLSTAWDVSTTSYTDTSFFLGTQDGAPFGIHFKPEGDKMYILGQTANSIFQYSTVANSASVTWPSNTEWQQGNAPVLTPGKSHLLEFYTSDGGSTYLASPVERDIA